ncbi:hypothetical protein S7711_03460 [Stachybotrys chartarum IBT 7711]|uniref:Uncharacterized protein n=1 Tax=Stachybotrys chartarum (strain CBS 109288 / IBT 7711) TaxID=1280523 RepID=A0A084AFT7_STACB|nr:hypothetical protein S7711_03460 [Stachybotrys chartarum IBT 7711]
MAAPRQKNANIRLLACLIDDDDMDDSDYRFLVDGQHVKYVSTAPGTFRGAEDDRTFEPILLGDLLPPFPAGIWNNGHIARNSETGTATFIKTEVLNELDFTRQNRIKQRVHVSTHPEVEGGRPVFIKLAVWPWEIPSVEVETAAYQWISRSGIGPKFLGHITEGKTGAW